MFNIFRNKEKIEKEEYSFLKEIVSKLPNKYDYLRNQITPDFILGKKPNPLGEKGSYTFLLNASFESIYSNQSLPTYFIIRDIKVWNKIKSSYEIIELDILRGMLAGYMIKSKISNLDGNIVDVSGIKEKKSSDKDKNDLAQILGKVNQHIDSILDISSSFKIELPEGNFYVIKNLGDGNYLTISQSGGVFIMIHDPYKLKKIFEDKDSFFDALTTGKFDIQKFYESQFS